MAKRRAVPKRRAKKVMSFHQVAGRKRSEPKADQLQKAVYSQEALEPENIKDPVKASDPTGNTAREDVFSLSPKTTKQFVEGTMEQYARAFSMFMPLAAPSLTRNAMQAIVRELLDYVAQQVRLNLQSMNALPTSHSPQNMLIAQNNFAKASSENIFEAASRISSIATHMAMEAGRLRRRGGQAA